MKNFNIMKKKVIQCRGETLGLAAFFLDPLGRPRPRFAAEGSSSDDLVDSFLAGVGWRPLFLASPLAS